MALISVPALLLVLELEDLDLELPVLLPDELLEPVELLPEPVEWESVVPEFVEDPDPWEASEPVAFEPEFPPVPELVLPLVSVPLLVPDSVFVLPEPVPVEPDESVEPDELSELDDPEGVESFSVVVPLLFGVLVLSVGVCWSGVDGDSVCSGEGVVTVGEIQFRTTLSVPLPWVMSSTMPAVTATANRPDTTVTITAVRLGLRRDARSSLTEYVWRERCAVGRETISRGVRRPAATMVFSGFSLAAASTRAGRSISSLCWASAASPEAAGSFVSDAGEESLLPASDSPCLAASSSVEPTL